ncbi:hypothetical protein [Amycolatopsis sp. NPDC051102]|uniref:hypothetical protein n=1 Tax=Amycolatopsis sp. NPDC051102 TaxID=3155163 RepID=UPI00342A22ED
MTASNFRESLSLEQIENSYGGDPPADATRLVATAHALRRRPIGTLEEHDAPPGSIRKTINGFLSSAE